MLQLPVVNEVAVYCVQHHLTAEVRHNAGDRQCDIGMSFHSLIYVRDAPGRGVICRYSAGRAVVRFGAEGVIMAVGPKFHESAY